VYRVCTNLTLLERAVCGNTNNMDNTKRLNTSLTSEGEEMKRVASKVHKERRSRRRRLCSWNLASRSLLALVL
jgi:hypothetical protein